MLEKLSEQVNLSLQQFTQHLPFAADKTLIDDCWTEAQQVLHAKHLAPVFSVDNHVKAMNEVPIIYQLGDACVHGIIDRLIIDNDKITIIDYKSHQHAKKENLASLSKSYHEQISLYVQGVKRLWPDYHIEAYLLFTHCAELHKMPV